MFFRQHPKPGKVAKTPNVLIILADDLGYSDLGCYGGEIETPNLDALATDGLRFSQFYNTARCWPTRASMMTGYYAQQVNRDKIAGRKFGGTRGGRPSWAKLLPELLLHQRRRQFSLRSPRRPGSSRMEVTHNSARGSPPPVLMRPDTGCA